MPIDLTWRIALTLIADAFLLGFGWSAGCWFGALITSLPRRRNG